MNPGFDDADPSGPPAHGGLKTLDMNQREAFRRPTGVIDDSRGENPGTSHATNESTTSPRACPTSRDVSTRR